MAEGQDKACLQSRPWRDDPDCGVKEKQNNDQQKNTIFLFPHSAVRF